jgi:hypothetical protein
MAQTVGRDILWQFCSLDGLGKSLLDAADWPTMQVTKRSTFEALANGTSAWLMGTIGRYFFVWRRHRHPRYSRVSIRRRLLVVGFPLGPLNPMGSIP